MAAHNETPPDVASANQRRQRHRRERRIQRELLQQQIMELIQHHDWRDRSSRDIAYHCQCSNQLVRRLRRQTGLLPATVRIANDTDRQIRTDRIGTRKGPRPRPLTTAQQQRVQLAVPIAQRFARNAANRVLEEVELLSVAHEAVILASRRFDCRRPDGDWRQFAYFGIKRAVKRAFYHARQRHRRELLLHLAKPEQLVDQRSIDPPTLYERAQALVGLSRLTVEWLAGVGNTTPRTTQYLARFLAVSVPVVDHLVEQAREELAE